jgi:hypothetical protein
VFDIYLARDIVRALADIRHINDFHTRATATVAGILRGGW